MNLAPCQPSSPGWNMNSTVPASDSRRAHRMRAAEASIAVCVSWPQACIVFSTPDLNGRPVSSGIGSASMSPRSSTVRPGRAPRSTATAPVVEDPVFHSSGRSASAARTLAIVFGVCSPSSGSAWIARRSATVSACIACAASYQPRGSVTTCVTMSFMRVSFVGGPANHRAESHQGTESARHIPALAMPVSPVGPRPEKPACRPQTLT